MKLGNLQFALRELRQRIGNKRAVLILMVVTVLCGMSGPFGTIESFGIFARMSYWGLIVFSTYCIGIFAHFSIMGAENTPSVFRQVITPFVSGIVIAIYVTGLNVLAIPDFPTDIFQRMTIFLYSFAVATIIAGAFYLVFSSQSKATATDETSLPCKLMERLPHTKRGALISLHAEDHYVRIETSKGSELVLMRLADAIDLTPPFKGIRLHRSHWVATEHVSDYIKSDNSWSVVLSNGETVPISRGYRNDAIDAGIIPARG